MFAHLAEASMSLDIGTLFVLAICVTSLLGLFLLFAWLQDGIQALAWWGTAYLIGGFSGTIWRLENVIPLPVPPILADLMLFIAVGMIWSAARVFHGRQVLWGSMCFGAVAWLSASFSPAFVQSPHSRIIVSSLIVATYTFMTAAELWRERRKSLIRRWPAIFVPMLHGAIFLLPVALAGFGDSADGRTLGTGWAAVFAIEVVLYVVGAAFVVLVLAKDRTVRQYKMAAATDPLTELLNRRGFFEAAKSVMASLCESKTPVSVLVFDLDHFKNINDQYGHKVGDAMLALFAGVVRRTMRTGDVIGRLGGEEFVALLPNTLADATVAAERVRKAFAAASAAAGSDLVPATVSIGVACGSAAADIDVLIARADVALYRAKVNGRDRVETAQEAVAAAPQRAEAGGRRAAAIGQPVPVLAVPLVGRLRPVRRTDRPVI